MESSRSKRRLAELHALYSAAAWLSGVLLVKQHRYRDPHSDSRHMQWIHSGSVSCITVIKTTEGRERQQISDKWSTWHEPGFLTWLQPQQQWWRGRRWTERGHRTVKGTMNQEDEGGKNEWDKWLVVLCHHIPENSQSGSEWCLLSTVSEPLHRLSLTCLGCCRFEPSWTRWGPRVLFKERQISESSQLWERLVLYSAAES